MDMTLNFFINIKEDICSLQDIEFLVKKLVNSKARDIKGFQAEIFKMGVFKNWE